MILAQIVTVIAAAVITGVAATLLTIYLTPKVQHHFWKLQRLAELRFATVKEVNRLMAEYLAGHISRDTEVDASWKPVQRILHLTARGDDRREDVLLR